MNQNSPIEEFYKNDAYVGFSGNFSPESHGEYVNFVKASIGSGKLVEIGSGLGAAAFSLHCAGVNVTATDIFPELCRKKFQELNVAIPVVELNDARNHLPTNSVENYSLFQVLEHLEDAEKCLIQCHRTLIPGGRIVIVSPNLLSPLSSGQAFAFGLFKKWNTPYFTRTDGYTFPLGGTVMESFRVFIKNFFLSIGLQFLKSLRIPRYRNPCFMKPAFSDSDAVFLTEPLTIKNMLEEIGYTVTSYQKRRIAGSFAGSVWIVAEKEHS